MFEASGVDRQDLVAAVYGSTSGKEGIFSGKGIHRMITAQHPDSARTAERQPV